jgi:hypothetical protein
MSDSQFIKFKSAVAAQFALMGKHELFEVDLDKDLLWATYLGSFPAGTNPIYRKNLWHDCSCCRSFIRQVGCLVSIIDGRLVSVWDINPSSVPEHYRVVARAMTDLVKSRRITGVHRTKLKTAGTDKNRELLDGAVSTYEHFFANLPARVVVNDVGIETSRLLATHDVFKRSLEEISMDAIDTVLDLVAQGSLYRGEEHKGSVQAFRVLKTKVLGLTQEQRELFYWAEMASAGPSATRIRNTAVGTLLVNLSEGKDLEYAVKAFESIMAPANYQRPKALVTKAMIEQAKKTLEELGLSSALHRRCAEITDVPVTNMLFVDKGTSVQVTGDVFDQMAAGVSQVPKNLDKIEEIDIEKFIRDVVPTAREIEVLVENKHIGNLVTLVAPEDPTAGQLFKWDNPFSWSYNGEFADSIKEKVKAAGGSVTGDICCRLAWFNTDDLDLHMFEPDGGEIYFGRKISRNGGCLDVDMNAGYGLTSTPVENIVYAKLGTMRDGTYTLGVHQYCQRNSKDGGFEVEIDTQGVVHRFPYPKLMGNNLSVTVAKLTKRGNTVTVEPCIPSSESIGTPKEVWGVKTSTFQKVEAFMKSPNCWGDRKVGNEHYFFMLKDCKNDGSARPFFNEFLKEDMAKHRKVFEAVGAKMRIDPKRRQLSGVGFSSTARNSVVVKVSGSFNRMLKVKF